MAVIVLGGATAIGYIDRVLLSVALPTISKEFQLSSGSAGLLLSAFSWTYFFCLVPAGKLIDRFGVKSVMFLAFAGWTLSCTAAGFAQSFAMLFFLRLLLGAGEAALYPAGASLVHGSFTDQNRGLASAIYAEGSKIGPAIGAPLAAYLLVAHGWRAMFIMVGLAGGLWLLFWYYLVPPMRASKREVRSLTGEPWYGLIARREVIGMMLGHFGYLYVFWVYLTWLPSYLIKERGFTLIQAGWYAAIPFVVQFFTGLIAGYAADSLIKRGHSPTVVRKSFIGAGLLLALSIVPAAIVESGEVAVMLLTFSLAGMGIAIPNILAIPPSIAREGEGGYVGGISQAAANLGGVIAPIATGLVLERYSFVAAVLIAGAMLVVSAVGYLLVLRRVAPMRG